MPMVMMSGWIAADSLDADAAALGFTAQRSTQPLATAAA